MISPAWRRAIARLCASGVLTRSRATSFKALLDMVTWNDDGTGVLIRNIDSFTERVLPRFFKVTARHARLVT